MEFIASENVELLWEIIMEEDIVKVIPKNRIYEFRQFYIGQIKQYSEYVVGRNTNIPLVKINQDFITGLLKKFNLLHNNNNNNNNNKANQKPKSYILQKKYKLTKEVNLKAS